MKYLEKRLSLNLRCKERLPAPGTSKKYNFAWRVRISICILINSTYWRGPPLGLSIPWCICVCVFYYARQRLQLDISIWYRFWFSIHCCERNLWARITWEEWFGVLVGPTNAVTFPPAVRVISSLDRGRKFLLLKLNFDLSLIEVCRAQKYFVVEIKFLNTKLDTPTGWYRIYRWLKKI